MQGKSFNSLNQFLTKSVAFLDYKPADHTSWDLGVASIQSALEAL